MTWQAWQQIEADDFAAAEHAYRVILDNFPGDPVAKFMLAEFGSGSAAFRALRDDIAFGRAHAPPPCSRAPSRPLQKHEIDQAARSREFPSRRRR
jgi:hypothetical protein